MNTIERIEINRIVESAKRDTDDLFYNDLKYLSPKDANLSAGALGVIERLCDSINQFVAEEQ